MGAGLQKFEIILNNSDKTFTSGDTVTGRVIVDIPEKMTLTGLEMVCKGEALGTWTDTKIFCFTRTKTYYKIIDTYFKMESYLLGAPRGPSVEIDAGRHVFPFKYVLPRCIPSSYKGTSVIFQHSAQVRYTIEATIHRAWKSDVHRSVLLMVQAPYDLSLNPIAKIPIQDEADEILGCFPFDAGSMTVNIFAPTRGFAIGEFIEAKFGIHYNSTSSVVKKIKLRLEKRVQLCGPKAPIPDYETLQETEKSGPFGDGDSIEMCIQVPATPPSGMPFCTVMTIQYFLHVEFVMSGISCNVERSYPILIGTKPALTSHSAENTCAAPPESNGDLHSSLSEDELRNLTMGKVLILLHALPEQVK